MMMMIYLLLYLIYNTNLSIVSIITHHGNDKDHHGIGDDDDSHNGDNGDW